MVANPERNTRSSNNLRARCGKDVMCYASLTRMQAAFWKLCCSLLFFYAGGCIAAAGWGVMDVCGADTGMVRSVGRFGCSFENGQRERGSGRV